MQGAVFFVHFQRVVKREQAQFFLDFHSSIIEQNIYLFHADYENR